jgi:hypothetical protein
MVASFLWQYRLADVTVKTHAYIYARIYVFADAPDKHPDKHLHVLYMLTYYPTRPCLGIGKIHGGSHELKHFDGFIVSHSPVFCRLFEVCLLDMSHVALRYESICDVWTHSCSVIRKADYFGQQLSVRSTLLLERVQPLARSLSVSPSLP